MDHDDEVIQNLRVPPHSIEAEQAVLGSLLLDNQGWDKIADLVSEHDFYRHDHRLIFKNIALLIEHNRPADVVTLSESLKQRAELDAAGGIEYIGIIAHNTPSSASIRHYAQTVRERSIMRALAVAGTEIIESVHNPMGREASQLLDEAEAKVFQIATSTVKAQQGFADIRLLLKEVLDRIDTLYQRKSNSDVTGLPSGFLDLDQMTSGFQPGDLIIVAGRPSMGKTAFSMNVAEYVGVETKKAVAVFSMEMGEHNWS